LLLLLLLLTVTAFPPSAAVLDHPITSSAIILALLALALSPYLLLGLGLLVVLGGVQLIPPQYKPYLPQPFRQAEDTVESIQTKVRKPVKALEEGLESTREGISAPLRKISSSVSSAKRAVEEPLAKVRPTRRKVGAVGMEM